MAVTRISPGNASTSFASPQRSAGAYSLTPHLALAISRPCTPASSLHQWHLIVSFLFALCVTKPCPSRSLPPAPRALLPTLSPMCRCTFVAFAAFSFFNSLPCALLPSIDVSVCFDRRVCMPRSTCLYVVLFLLCQTWCVYVYRSPVPISIAVLPSMAFSMPSRTCAHRIFRPRISGSPCAHRVDVSASGGCPRFLVRKRGAEYWQLAFHADKLIPPAPRFTRLLLTFSCRVSTQSPSRPMSLLVKFLVHPSAACRKCCRMFSRYVFLLALTRPRVVF